MNDITFTRKRKQPFKFSDAERARIGAAPETPVADPDNPPLEGPALHRMEVAREVRMLRQRTGLSQPQFAARWKVSLGRLRDYEQARVEPDVPMLAYFTLISDYPDIAADLVGKLDR